MMSYIRRSHDRNCTCMYMYICTCSVYGQECVESERTLIMGRKPVVSTRCWAIVNQPLYQWKRLPGVVAPVGTMCSGHAQSKG